jgi:hypothetical protein
VVATSGKQGENEEGEERGASDVSIVEIWRFFCRELKAVTAVFAGVFENSERW